MLFCIGFWKIERWRNKTLFIFRRALATEENVIKHAPGRVSILILEDIVDRSEDQPTAPAPTNLCNSRFHHYIPPLRWMIGLEEHSQGALECPRCHDKVGSYRWLGMPCPCGQLIVPGFALLKHMVMEGGWEAAEQSLAVEGN